MTALRRTKADVLFDLCNYVVLAIILLIVLYPLYFIVIASFSDPRLVSVGKVWAWPKGITFDGYKMVFANRDLVTGFRNSLFYTVLGTSINLLLTLPSAYALSRTDLKGRNVFTFILVLTMFFSGGLIPTYILVKNLGMLNTVWALVIPNAVGVWNIIIARTFFQATIPKEMLEAAIVDGCTNRKFFVSVVLPLSTSLIAVMVLFYSVGHWNSYFNALIYLKDKEMYPLQLVLREILVQNSMEIGTVNDRALMEQRQLLAESIKYAAIIIASIPVLILYPFLQKYFVKGIMIGSIKG